MFRNALKRYKIFLFGESGTETSRESHFEVIATKTPLAGKSFKISAHNFIIASA